jgi:hypothetical protein
MEQDEPILPSKKEKKKKLAKTAGTMFRNTMANHLQLSAMADRKAGLLVSINAIIISIMTSFLVHELTSNPKLLVPTCLLIAVCLFTITFALLSTRPNVTPLSKKMLFGNNPNIDLLFFGDYTQLSIDDYKTAMKNMITNDAQMHDKMIENIYAQGKVMQRKYYLLKIAYTIFMVGFPAAIVFYLVALF